MFQFLEKSFKDVTFFCKTKNNNKQKQQKTVGVIRHEPGHEKMRLMSFANNKGADQPAHPRSRISIFVVRCLDSIISLDSIAEISRLWLASVAVQAGCIWPGRKLPKTRFVVSWLTCFAARTSL